MSQLGLIHAALSTVALLAAAPSQAAGDAVRGAQTYAVSCGSCHAVDTDEVGPRHAGVVGRRAGSVAGFSYSPALKGSRITWNQQTLERWLANPEALVPGQAMGYRLADAAARADVIAYLATLKRK